ncbi:MAG: class I SAM-dependent methyltransferase [candidate division WOR-3 bacterium]|nr:MAG: class I SAM-dependent methyltransferase [candidate division WOR-3 bacterium]
MIRHDGYDRAAVFYDLFDTKDNVDFFHHYAQPTGIIADIGAGTGRIAIPLAARGIQVYCVEPSEAMLKEFEKKLAKDIRLSRRITLQKNDAAAFEFDRRFPAAFLSGAYDHFMDDDERIAALSNMHRHLETGGKIVFDVFLGSMKNSPLHPAGSITQGTTEYRRYIKSTIGSDNRIEVLLVYEKYQRGRLTQRIEQQSQAAVVNRKQTHEVLAMTGFEVVHEYSDYQFKKFTPGDDLLIVEAERT